MAKNMITKNYICNKIINNSKYKEIDKSKNIQVIIPCIDTIIRRYGDNCVLKLFEFTEDEKDNLKQGKCVLYNYKDKKYHIYSDFYNCSDEHITLENIFKYFNHIIIKSPIFIKFFSIYWRKI